MRFFERTLHSARITMLKNWFSAKNLVALVLMVSTLVYTTDDLRTLCRVYPLTMQPFGIFVFCNTSFFSNFMLLFSFLLMMCDAPFVDDMQTQVILRTGKSCWVVGQIQFIFFTSLTYCLLILLSIVLCCVPRVDFSFEWGRLLLNISSHQLSVSKFAATSAVIQNFSLTSAFFISFGLQLLLLFFIGLVMFCVNLLSEKRYGMLIAFAMLFFHWQFLGGFGFPYKLLKISPVSLANLMLLDPKARGVFPTYGYAFTFFLVSIALLSAASILSVRKKTFSSIKIQGGAQ